MHFFTNTGLRVLDASGAVLEAGAVVGTGCVVELLVNGAKVDSCVVVVAGDVNGDGRITASDYILVKREILVGGGRADRRVLRGGQAERRQPYGFDVSAA